MRITPSGRAISDKPCALCGEHHPEMDDTARKAFLSLGLSETEIDAIAQEQRDMAHYLGVHVPEPKLDADGLPHIAPSAAPAKVRERVRKHRALRRQGRKEV